MLLTIFTDIKCRIFTYRSRESNTKQPDHSLSAAIYGLRNKADISIFILHPKGRVSPIQEAQMTTVTDYNVHNVAVRGTFDDCQVRGSFLNICRCARDVIYL